MLADQNHLLLAQGRIGIVDAALVRWLIQQRTRADRLVVRVTGSIFEPLLPKKHIEEFLAALEPVDEVVQDEKPAASQAWSRTALEGVSVVPWPEAELLDYSVARICKRQPLVEEETVSPKLTTPDWLCAQYGPRPRRQRTVGIVSGSYDLIHTGHVRLFLAAKQLVDVLVVLTMSTTSIQHQEKNRLGDRPIYNGRDRMDVLSALRPVDHVVIFDELNCSPALLAFCPDYFVKSERDRSRGVVKAEAALVKSLGGKAAFLSNHHPGYSSTTVIQHVRQQTETQGAHFLAATLPPRSTTGDKSRAL